jgi:DNA topoisomerase-1
MTENKKEENINNIKQDDETSNFNKRQFWKYERLNALNNKTNKNNQSKNNKNTKNKNTKNTKNKNTKSTKKQFHIINNKVVTDAILIKRLNSIYIPPMYKDLVVAKSENNKIQAIGTDARGRRQYVYNPKYTKKRNNRKYDNIMDLGKAIVKIEKDNEIALNTLASKSYDKWSLPKDYVPIIIYMLRMYHFRIGNECYANDNNSYGITTLKKDHIVFTNNNKFKIEFIGKKGILNSYTDNNPKSNIVKILKILIANASKDGYIFKYDKEKDGLKQSIQFITPDIIQSFFLDNYNSEITPKMFRTWYGNYHMIEHLHDLYKEGKIKPKMKKMEIKQIISKCSEHVSSKLNNTPTVSKQSYIDNKILDLVIKNPYRFASKIPSSNDEKHKFLYEIIMKLRHL